MEEENSSGWMIGKYEIRELIGRGGFGTVYRAYDTRLEVERAVKILHPILNSSPEYITRFTREARLVARMDHPHIVPVYDFGQEGARYFLVMKYMPGGSLSSLLKDRGPLPFKRILEVMRDSVAVLDYAHSEGLIHRDVKPANVLFEASRAARLGDFGFARALTGKEISSLSLSGGLIGTPAYMAPELWRNRPATPASDIYSLGCLVTEMLSGQVLFSGDSPAEIMTSHVLDGPRFPQRWPSDAPPGIEGVLRKALERKPEDRFQSASDFYAALRDLGQAEPAKAKTQGDVTLLKSAAPVQQMAVQPQAAVAGPAAGSGPPETVPTSGSIRWPKLKVGQNQKILAYAAALLAFAVLGLCLVGSSVYASVAASVKRSQQQTLQAAAATPKASGTSTVTPTKVSQAAIGTQTARAIKTQHASSFFRTQTAESIESIDVQKTRSRWTQLAATPTAAARTAVYQVTRAAQAEIDLLLQARSDWSLVTLDSFESNANGWTNTTIDDEYGTRNFVVENGKYTVSAAIQKPVFFWPGSDLESAQDFLASVDIHVVAENTGDSWMATGLIFRENDAGYYSFRINQGGYMSVKYFNKSTGEWTDVMAYQESQAIRKDSTNRLAVLAQGQQVRLYINDRPAGKFTDFTVGTGEVAPSVSLFDAGDSATVEFDNFELRVP